MVLKPRKITHTHTHVSHENWHQSTWTRFTTIARIVFHWIKIFIQDFLCCFFSPAITFTSHTHTGVSIFRFRVRETLATNSDHPSDLWCLLYVFALVKHCCIVPHGFGQPISSSQMQKFCSRSHCCSVIWLFVCFYRSCWLLEDYQNHFVSL